MSARSSRIPVLLLAFGIFAGCGGALRALGLAPKRDDVVAPELPVGFDEGGALRVLVFSKTQGFRHEDAIVACDALVKELGEAAGWRVFATENAAVFDDALLDGPRGGHRSLQRRGRQL